MAMGFAKILIAMFSVGIFLLIGDWLQKHTNLHREIVRKVVHMGVAVAISASPFYLSWQTIQILAAALIIIVALALHFGWGSGMHRVRRKTHGEILFPIAVLGVSIFAPSPAAFCAATLFLGLADGLAAIIGVLFGKNNSYRVLGNRKSIAGTSAFLIAGFAIMIAYNMFATHPVPFAVLLLLPIFAAVFENIGLNGTDNITVPMLVIITLSSL